MKKLIEYIRKYFTEWFIISLGVVFLWVMMLWYNLYNEHPDIFDDTVDSVVVLAHKYSVTKAMESYILTIDSLAKDSEKLIEP